MKLSDLTIVTSSPDKLAEINAILGTDHKVSKIETPEIQSLDLNKVITEKVKAAFKIVKKPVLVEDISLEIKALNALPGTFIKFFLERLGTEGTVKLVGREKTDTTVTAAVAVYDGRDLKIFKGTVFGTLSRKNRGSGGFGFDKVFIPQGYHQTYAEMPASVKNQISHRAKTLRKVKRFLTS